MSTRSPALPLPSFLLEVGPLKSREGIWGSAVSSSSGVWGTAPAEIELKFIAKMVTIMNYLNETEILLIITLLYYCCHQCLQNSAKPQLREHPMNCDKPYNAMDMTSVLITESNKKLCYQRTTQSKYCQLYKQVVQQIHNKSQ